MPVSAIFMPERARRNNMDYFYEHESELFTFYRVPKVLFTEEPDRKSVGRERVSYEV